MRPGRERPGKPEAGNPGLSTVVWQASMRPGRERPGKTESSLTKSGASNEEPGRERPGKLAGFNEAGARTPRKDHHADAVVNTTVVLQ